MPTLEKDLRILRHRNLLGQPPKSTHNIHIQSLDPRKHTLKKLSIQLMHHQKIAIKFQYFPHQCPNHSPFIPAHQPLNSPLLDLLLNHRLRQILRLTSNHFLHALTLLYTLHIQAEIINFAYSNILNFQLFCHRITHSLHRNSHHSKPRYFYLFRHIFYPLAPLDFDFALRPGVLPLRDAPLTDIYPPRAK